MSVSVHLIVFSKDRPLQLHGYLTSLFQQWHGEVRVDAIVRADNAYNRAYAEALDDFQGRVTHWHEHPQEGTFARCLSGALERAAEPLTCFGCDDAVFVAPVVGDALGDAFAARDDLLGVSLRLGANVRRGMWGQAQAQPAFLPDPHGAPWDDARRAAALLWDCTAPGSVGDWAYPWEVVGTVYRTGFVRALVADLAAGGRAGSPSHLEAAGARAWWLYAEGRHLLRCWHRSRLVLPAINVVQEAFPNGVTGGGPQMDPAFLLECWERGLRLDPFRYAAGPVSDSWRTGDLFLRRAP